MGHLSPYPIVILRILLALWGSSVPPGDSAVDSLRSLLRFLCFLVPGTLPATSALSVVRHHVF